MTTPIFSGNVESYDVNLIAERDIVKKGRRYSNLIKQNISSDISNQLINLKNISILKIQDLLKH